jgi:tetratricopeptide (TPR) repeat protein
MRIAMADRVAGRATRLDVVQAASSAMLYFAEPAERVRLNRQLAELARGAGEPARVLRAHVRLVFDHLELNDPAAADAAIAACEGLARELSHPAYLWQTPLLRAMRAVMQGRFGEAEELAARARALAEKVDDPNRALALAGQRLGLLLGAARHDALETEAADLVAVVYRAVDLYYAASFAAMVWARLGRLDRVRAELSRLPADTGWARGRMMAGWVAEAAAALGDADLAGDLVDVLRPLAGRNLSWGVGSFVSEDSMARSLGIALSVAGRHDEAVASLEEARVRVAALGAPPLAVRLELDTAAALLRRGEPADRERARGLLESAQASADQLGLPAFAEAAAGQLERLAPAPARPAPPQVRAVPTAIGFSLERDGEVWAASWGGAVFRLQDSRGMQILAHLIAHPGQEFHVTDLSAPGGAPGHVEDAGEVLDQEAIASYRRRLEEVREELDEAERWNDEGRQGRLREEMEFLAAELGRAVGLGGRRRMAGSSSEKARVNVKRRLTHAIGKISELSPGLGAHLEWAVKTGVFCSYRPG